MSEARVLGSERTPHASPRREQSQERARGVPGKRTLTQSLSRSADAPAPPPATPVQRRCKTLAELTDDPCMDAAHRGAAAGAFDPAPVQAKGDLPTSGHEGIHHAANQGTAGAGARLPFLDRLQEAFGPAYDLGSVQAHVGGPAADACDRIGATAYASGEHVAFRGNPDLHTAAHEATHVVQQRAGVALNGGVGQVGDAYERQADAIADAVMRGQSAAPLLGPGGGGAGAGATSEVGPVQRHANAAAAVQREAAPSAPAPAGPAGCATCAAPGEGQAEVTRDEAAEQGRQALQLVGYEKLIEMAIAAGLLPPPPPAQEGEPVQRQAAAAAATFGELFAPWATAAGVASQVDSPAPGPGDVVALGILAVGLIAAGVTVLMAAPGNQADTGILDEAYALIRAGAAAEMCAALALLMEQARRAGDTAKMQRIKKTQKAKDCRHSRHS